LELNSAAITGSYSDQIAFITADAARVVADERCLPILRKDGWSGLSRSEIWRREWKQLLSVIPLTLLILRVPDGEALRSLLLEEDGAAF
jgi:hypothetical protein